MMKGPNIEATRELALAISIPVTISGGMSSLDDVRAVRPLEADGIDEVIIGRALYLEKFSVQEAVATAAA
jgi:phosphoribosylformimino-5-aminoimidazole carboxamide ribonucleotide (ProFAR) isomerase